MYNLAKDEKDGLGKEETIDFRIPIARIEQERKEEARLLPGLVRTDEPVFNVPRPRESHVRAWQDHEVIMILPDGRRIYRFYSWDTKLTTSKDYLYTDIGICDYLESPIMPFSGIIMESNFYKACLRPMGASAPTY